MNSTETNQISLREFKEGDLDIFFKQQLDQEANQMAGFTARDPSDIKAFDEKWEKILADKNIIVRTIIYDNRVAGSMMKHDWFGVEEVSYWIGKEFWGKGIATKSLKSFITELNINPIFARVASDNLGSIRVLEKCGFVRSGTDKGFANARGKEIEEYIFKLELSIQM